MLHRYSVLLLIAALSTACVKQPVKTTALTEEPPASRGIQTDRAGVLVLGEAPPAIAFEGALEGWNYDAYWDLGYFVKRDLRMVFVDVADTVLLMSPKHTLYQVLVGPTYQTANGVQLGDNLETLQSAHGETQVTATSLDPALVYRPDRVTWDPESLNGPGTADQAGWKPLQCAATTKTLPQVQFFFESCALAEGGAPIEAILVTAASDADLQMVDPIVDLRSPPACPAPRTDDAKALALQAEAELNTDKMGEHHNHGSVVKALPMLRDAAISGSRDAGGSYASILFSYVGIDVVGDPLDRPMTQGAQESLLFWLLHAMSAENPPEDDSCLGALLNFERPVPEALFEDDGDENVGECAWLFTYPWVGGVEGIEAIRQQARMWSACWAG